jgi:hypothetical protein
MADNLFDPAPTAGADRARRARVAALLAGVPVAAALSVGALASPFATTTSVIVTSHRSVQFHDGCDPTSSQARLVANVAPPTALALKWPVCGGD